MLAMITALVLGQLAAAADIDVQFSEFKAAFSKTYSSPAEESRRLNIFRQNLQLIDATNRQGHTSTLGVGPFADLDAAEFMARYTNPSPPAPIDWSLDSTYLGEHVAVSGEALPPSLDWVEKKAVTAVKSQQCGNCWTFSAAGSIEGAYAIAKGHLTNFSEQVTPPLLPLCCLRVPRRRVLCWLC